MIARLLSLLALVAVLVMPLSAAPAQAMPADAVRAMAEAGHCSPERMPDTEKSLPGSHCGAACTLLLPQPTLFAGQVEVRRATPRALPPIALDDRMIALGTPPPKLG